MKVKLSFTRYNDYIKTSILDSVLGNRIIFYSGFSFKPTFRAKLNSIFSMEIILDAVDSPTPRSVTREKIYGTGVGNIKNTMNYWPMGLERPFGDVCRQKYFFRNYHLLGGVFLNYVCAHGLSLVEVDYEN